MPRAIWSGAISFGLVNIPVKLYSAVSKKTVRFHQLDSKDNSRIHQKRVNPSSGEEVPYEQLVKGYELSPDRYVVVGPEELHHGRRWAVRLDQALNEAVAAEAPGRNAIVPSSTVSSAKRSAHSR